ncbi:Putative acyl carrier protein (ACP) (modular protein) [Xanthomonas citri pv. citri]|nr:Putative acyl carrier protein (ACP) (modular protein) [Xanthomonas citri pv. citri]CEH56106.1 Putative acyl carrier protein (ACP) (modular protein) [Xanthomonas citri pv. citri]CEH64693.1 Putative acyl carrier protein (ACP) (modular protein) [Xanthomonas citri pv. citri]
MPADGRPRCSCLFSLLLSDPDLWKSWMSSQTAAERELAELLVESLNLEDVQPADIDPEAPLFNTGLGLDSIDALELALAISKRYGFQLRSDNDENRRIFASLRALSAHVQANKTV